ncbi:unannotated protein [freshwater metagenome]|uniref:Unannotated protein n=1 Tax=freshwater metagenome TaxID=449393 RepID=A0A6J7EGS3_9ZZZZ|nr:hypothetical protein [Actinomycetota bacterium]
MPADVRLYGIRHHGPGSALAIRRALNAEPPDVVLIEGPREADGLAFLVADPTMRPPVTMLGYAIDHPDNAVFHPFASFSPEWVALRWAADAEVPVRFIDLALANTLAAWPDQVQPSLGDGLERPSDPLGELALAAGYDDAERWWEDVVEHRHGTSLFAAIGEAMTVLRQAYQPDLVPTDPMERRREAQMRVGIRTAIKDGFERIVVVCGAWHVPALVDATNTKQARSDTALLRGMPKTKVAITWVPWTHRRLASATGYGAGVTSPGWYHHLFSHPGHDTIARWFTEAARVLRAGDYGASAADVVEATRLATSLAALRGRPLAGLVEVNDAAQAVLGDGTDTPMRLLSNDLIVGTLIGRVPDRTPMVPLSRNLALEQKRLRLKPEAASRALELDLRKPLDLSRSRLLHRLAVLGVPWGREVDGRRTVGTFRETWQLQWEPELEVRLIESSALGTTVESAAAAALAQQAAGAPSLTELTAAVERCLLADLSSTLPGIVQLIADRAALDLDVARLMEALPPLSRTVRYGDVRGTDATALGSVLHGMVVRIAAGLAPACISLDDDSAAAMAVHINDTQAALSLLGADLLAAFHLSLAEVVERELVHSSLQGRATRLLADAGRLANDDVAKRVSRALSRGTPAPDGAAFIEGFLGGSGTVLVHDADLLAMLDGWLATLDSSSFIDTLPLLRRTFGTFETAERRQIGERVRTGQAPAAALGTYMLDPERVAAGLDTIAQLLGAPR